MELTILLEAFVGEDTITCEERDRITLRIAEKHGFIRYSLSTFAVYGRSKWAVLERVVCRKESTSLSKKYDESYITLTKIAQAYSKDSQDMWFRFGREVEMR